MIIVEGVDNSGKSTLVKYFAEMGFKTHHPGGPPKSEFEEKIRLIEHLADVRRPIVYDRVTAISQQVYADKLWDPLCVKYLDLMLDDPRCVIVYCRPPTSVIMDFKAHTLAEHDTPEHVQYVKDNLELLIRRYDDLMYKIPHITYDWTMSSTFSLSDVARTQRLGDYL